MLGWLLQKVNAQMGCFAIIRGHQITVRLLNLLRRQHRLVLRYCVTEPIAPKQSVKVVQQKNPSTMAPFTDLIMHLNDIFVALLFLV